MSNKNFIGKFRLKITDYFDSVINEIDLFTETLLKANFDDETEANILNETRNELLNQVKEIEKVNLNHLNENRDALLDDQTENVFVEFCFVLQFDQYDIRLIITDKFLPPNEVTHLKSVFLNSVQKHDKRLCVQMTQRKAIDKLFDCETDSNPVKYPKNKHFKRQF
jgi:hypothetical protein